MEPSHPANKSELQTLEKTQVDLTSRQQILVVLGAFIGVACGCVPVTLGALGIFLKPMAFTFNWSRADISLLPMLVLIGAGIGAPCIGYIADRRGWNRVIAYSITLFSLGLLAMSAAPASRTYIITIGILIGIGGVGTTAAGYISVISRTFDRNLGMALGFAMLGSSVGASVVPILASKLIEVVDWRNAYVFFAGYALLLGFIAHQIIFRILAGGKSAVYVSTNNETTNNSRSTFHPDDGLTFVQAIRNYRYWVLAAVGTLTTSVIVGFGIHLVSYATDQGVSISLAAQYAGLGAFGGAVAKLVVGLLLDRVFAPMLAFIVFLMATAGFYLLTADVAQTAWILPLAAIFIMVAYGAEADIMPFIIRKYFGIKAFGSIYGSIYSLSVFGSALSAYLYGWCFDLAKSYVPILQVAAIFCCVSGLAMLTLGRYPFSMNNKITSSS